MDTLRGNFGLPDDDENLVEGGQEWDSGDDETGRDVPPAAIGTDERRMQVRAYNHWASLLDDRAFPSIEDLEPGNLPDFGPFSVLLDFTHGLDDPAILYLGEELAAECGADIAMERLSDIPSRSLLSRITDHYMQILANQAPIGFEAEFVNQRDATILYRGILLPYSSDGETIDFIYGVINWKEIADQMTSDELLLEIDQALDDTDPGEGPLLPTVLPVEVEDWADGPGHEIADFPSGDAGEEADDNGWPVPEFGSLPDAIDGDNPSVSSATDDWDDRKYFVDYGNSPEEDEEFEEDEAVVSRLSSLIAPRASGELSWSEEDEDEDGTESPIFAPRSPLLSKKQALPPLGSDTVGARVTYDEPSYAAPGEEDAPVADDAFATPIESAPDDHFTDTADEAVPALATSNPATGLYDCLAEARELAQAARSSEDRSRTALYAAVGRAYDVCLAAEADPEEFDELVAENGLTTQERAPMTPVVKLVFGADYDKSRLAEYASVLAHARRLEVARGELAGFLATAEGGLKGVVQAERRMRREEAGKPIDPVDSVRPSLAKKLRKLEGLALADLGSDGSEFGIVVIRRCEDGAIVALGEISDDIALVEKVARKLV